MRKLTDKERNMLVKGVKHIREQRIATGKKSAHVCKLCGQLVYDKKRGK